MNPPQTSYVSNFNIGGINLYVNPLFHGYAQQVMQSDGELIRAVNVDSHPLGAKMKRPGYITFLGTSDGAQVNSMFWWAKDDGTSVFVYRFSGSQLYYWNAGQGTGTAWNVCGNGTFTGTHIGNAVLNNIMIVGDGVGSTRHTTDGTSFTNTTLAPAGEFFEQYQNRIFVAGTGSTLTYSTTGDPTNWQISGTSDSSSLTIPGAGKINKLFKLGDRLHISKSLGNIFRWDGYSLVDTATTLGPTSPYSYGSIENSGLYINRLGIYMMDVSGPQIISNTVGRFIYNENNTGMLGTAFGSAPGFVHRYDYYLAVGSTRDDVTDEPLNNGILKYSVIKNEWLTYQFNDAPTAWVSYQDNTGSQTMLFGNASGQCFKYGGTATADNGSTIPSVIDMVFNFNAPHFEKDWRWFWGFFNPGCEAQVQIAFGNTFSKGSKNWIDLGDARQGVVSYRFPTGSRSRLLYLRIKEASKTARFIFYGATLGAIVKDPG